MSKVWVRFTFFLLAAFAPIWASDAAAACTGSNPTWTSTPDRASVAACVNNAANGATINVTAGSATWSPNISIVNKSLTITGAGASSTLITGGFNLYNSGSRISGFRFNNSNWTVEGSIGFRIHNNTFQNPSWTECILFIGSTDSGFPSDRRPF